VYRLFLSLYILYSPLYGDDKRMILMALIIEVKVVPRSGRQQWIMDKSGMLKCFLKSAPEKGQANAELIDFVAKSIGAARAQVELISGHAARKKKIKIDKGLTCEQFLQQLGLQKSDKQASLF
jgi:uncharacterized protein (TIGR00251 family)